MLRINTSYGSLLGYGNNSGYSLYSSLSQMSSVRSGAYSKALKAYYGKNSNTSSIWRNTSSNLSVNSELGSVKRESGELVDSVKKLTATGKNNLFADKEKYDPDEAYKAVSAFVTDYNETLDSANMHYASRDAMDIEGFSEKTAELLVNEIGLHNIPELYELNKSSFSGLAGFGEKKISNILNAIEKSKDCSLASFIFALGIPNVGIKTARDIAKRFGSIEAFRKCTRDELVKIRDVGDIVADSIMGFLSDESLRMQVDKLLSLGVAPENVEKADVSMPLEGKTLVVTGTLSRMDRRSIEALIESLGGKAAGSVSRKTDYVVYGENAGSKLAKATELGVKLLTEDEFFKLIDN